MDMGHLPPASTNQNGKSAKVVHLSSVHSAFDIRIFHKECKSLAQAGLDVMFVAPHSRDEVVDKIQIRAVPVQGNRLRRFTKTIWDIFRESQRQSADLYHFHDPELILVGLFLRAQGKRVIYDIHEDVPKDILAKHYLPQWSRQIIARIADGIESIAGKRFTALVAVTPSIAERFRRYNQRTFLVQNFPRPSEISQSAASNWEAREQRIVYTGGLNRNRGIREMVEAMGLLPASCPALLDIASAEQPTAVVPELVGSSGWSRVHYRGNLNRAQIAQLLGQARVGAVLFHPVPNNLESMPHKLFEYMAAGIPVVASNFSFWQKTLGPWNCVHFVDPKKPQEIAKAMEYLISHPVEAEQMGRRGQQAVHAIFNWDTQAQELLKLYSMVLGHVCAE